MNNYEIITLAAVLAFCLIKIKKLKKKTYEISA